MKYKIKMPFLTAHIKLNWNCPKDEKTGEGPGSCKSLPESKSQDFAHGMKIIESHNQFGNKSYEVKGIDGKTLYSGPNEKSALKEIKRLTTYYNKNLDKAPKISDTKSVAMAKSESESKSKSKPPSWKIRDINTKGEKSIIEKGKELIGKPLKDIKYSSELFEYFQSSVNVNKMLIENPNGNYSQWKHPKEVSDESRKLHVERREKFGGTGFKNREEELAFSAERIKTLYDTYTKNQIYAMDHYIDQSIIEEPIIVYSGISPEYWNDLPKNIGDEFKTSTFMSASRDPEIAKEFAENRKRIIESEGFTITGKRVSEKSEDAYVVELHLNKGAKALSMEPFYEVNYPHKMFNLVGKERPMLDIKEVVIGRNSTYRIKGIEQGKGIKKLILESS